MQAEQARGHAVEALTRTGVVDDARLAASVARGLADREWGDAAISYRLRQLGLDRDSTESAIAALDPEEQRAEAAVRRRGRTVSTGRALIRRGFSEHVVEALLPDVLADPW